MFEVRKEFEPTTFGKFVSTLPTELLYVGTTMINRKIYMVGFRVVVQPCISEGHVNGVPGVGMIWL